MKREEGQGEPQGHQANEIISGKKLANESEDEQEENQATLGSGA